MEYKHIKTVKNDDGLCILIETDGVQLWVDCWKCKGDWEFDFNKWIFFNNNSNDMKEKAMQDKINEDFEAFYYFMDDILEKYEKGVIL